MEAKRGGIEPLYKHVGHHVFDNFYLQGILISVDKKYYKYRFKKIVFADSGKFLGCEDYDLEDIISGSMGAIKFVPFFDEDKIFLFEELDGRVVQQKMFRIIPNNVMLFRCRQQRQRDGQINKLKH